MAKNFRIPIRPELTTNSAGYILSYLCIFVIIITQNIDSKVQSRITKAIKPVALKL